MSETASTTASPIREGWPTVREIGGMQPYEFEFWRVGMGEHFPTSEELERAGAPAKAILLGEEHRRWAYFVRAETGLIKIGVAADVAKRVSALRTSSPVPLELLAQTRGGRELEADYHERFAAHRSHGEWFAPAPAILAEIARLTPTYIDEEN